jgi:DNA gyrase subunit A
MVVTVTHGGYVKRVPLSTYRTQRRGGKGRSGMSTKDEDFVARVFVASTHTPVLFFSSRRQGLQAEGLAAAARRADRRAARRFVNLLPIEQGERITTIMPLPEDEASWEALDVMFATTAARAAQQALRLRRRSIAPARSP